MLLKRKLALLLAATCLLAGGCSSTPSTWRSRKAPDTGRQEEDHAGAPVIPGEERVAAAAETEVALPTPLACGDAERIALERSPHLQAALSRINAAEAHVTGARAGYYPTLELSANGTRSRQNFATINIPGVDLTSRQWSYNAALQSNWILLDGLAREARLYGARSGLAESLAAFEDVRRLLVEAVDAAYNNALLARENIRIAEADAAFNGRLLDETRFKEEAGSASLSDRLNFEIRLNGAKSQLLQAKNDRCVAEAVLFELMGLPHPPPSAGLSLSPLDMNESRDLAPPDVETELGFALARRPDLEGLRAAIETSECQVSESRAASLPTLFLQGSYGYQRIDNPNFDGDDRVVSASLNLAWNLFNGFADSSVVRAAKNLTTQRRKELASRWLVVISEVRQAATRLKTAQEQFSLQKDNLRLTSKARDLVLKEYNAGQASLVRLNEAQRDLINAEGNFALARIAVRQLRDTLNAATSRNLF